MVTVSSKTKSLLYRQFPRLSEACEACCYCTNLFVYMKDIEPQYASINSICPVNFPYSVYKSAAYLSTMVIFHLLLLCHGPSLVPPDEGYVKINIHCVSVENPGGQANANGVGVIIRNEDGEKLWGAMGPMQGMSNTLATLWGIHAGAVECIKRKCKRMHFETDNQEVWLVIRFQEEIQIAEELQEVMTSFSTIYANNFEESISSRIVSRIPVDQNRTAQYMAVYGMENLSHFAEAPGVFGNLQHFLDRDMGMAMPFAIMDNFGLGEVIDADIPEDDPMIVNDDLEEEEVFLNAEQIGVQEVGLELALVPYIGPVSETKAELTIEHDGMELDTSGLDNNMKRMDSSPLLTASSKGKTKWYTNCKFYENGLLCAAARHILDSGILAPVSSLFAQEYLDLESEVWNGVKAWEVLEQAVEAWEVLEQAVEAWEAQNGEAGPSNAKYSMDLNTIEQVSNLTDIAEVLAEWDKFEPTSSSSYLL